MPQPQRIQQGLLRQFFAVFQQDVGSHDAKDHRVVVEFEIEQLLARVIAKEMERRYSNGRRCRRKA